MLMLKGFRRELRKRNKNIGTFCLAWNSRACPRSNLEGLSFPTLKVVVLDMNHHVSKASGDAKTHLSRLLV